MLWAIIIANVFALGFQPLYAILSDRVGRKPVFIGGVLACAVAIYPYFMAITSGNTFLVFLGSFVLTSVAYSAPNAIWPAFYNEMFSSRVRYSGVALGTQFGFLLAGFSPAIGKAIAGEGDKGWLPVAVFTSVCCVIAAISASTARETYRLDMHELGHARSVPREAPTVAGSSSHG
jgi:MFS family permease